jgi:hypothetical protein
MRTKSLGIAAFELFLLSKHITTIGLEGSWMSSGYRLRPAGQMQGLISVHMYPF